MMRGVAACLIVAASRVASAQPAETPPETRPAEPTPPPEPTPPVVPAPTEPRVTQPTAPRPAELAEQLEQLEDRVEKVDVLEQRIESRNERLATLLPLRKFLTVYIDVGWFAVGGNGSGIRSDVGHRTIHDFDMVPANWVFVGDPLSTAINSLGEPADIGDARAIKDDTVNSKGHPSFIANSIALAIGRNVGHGISVAGLVEFLPRPGPDILDVELARIDYRPSNQIDLVFSAGKIDSVLGVEYRSQDAPRRLTVTPSLACRYTCGRPYGVQGRLTRGRLSASLSLTNGDNFDERFEPSEQLSYHKLPTAAGHLQWMLPVGQGLEVGVSGAVGPQDNQEVSRVHQWHYGVDLRLRDLHGVDVYAEYVQGKQQGSSLGAANLADAMSVPSPVPHCTVSQCLTYKAAYALAGWRANAWLTPYARIDWRDARHQNGIDFLYVTNTVRVTMGLHVQLTSRIIAKVEYTANRELGTFQFPNDVLTSSVVVSTD